jgi:hypothetical protein
LLVVQIELVGEEAQGAPDAERAAAEVVVETRDEVRPGRSVSVVTVVIVVVMATLAAVMLAFTGRARVSLLGASAGATVSKAAAPPPIGKTRMRMHCAVLLAGAEAPDGV